MTIRREPFDILYRNIFRTLYSPYGRPTRIVAGPDARDWFLVNSNDQYPGMPPIGYGTSAGLYTLFGLPFQVDENIGEDEVQTVNGRGEVCIRFTISGVCGPVAAFEYQENPSLSSAVESMRSRIDSNPSYHNVPASVDIMVPETVIDRIDSAIADAERCACGCGQRVASSSPSEWFFSEECSARWHEANGLEYDPIDDGEPGGIDSSILDEEEAWRRRGTEWTLWVRPASRPEEAPLTQAELSGGEGWTDLGYVLEDTMLSYASPLPERLELIRRRLREDTSVSEILAAIHADQVEQLNRYEAFLMHYGRLPHQPHTIPPVIVQ